jgi:putative transposase
MSKKSKKIDQQIDSINQINLTNKIVEELLSKANRTTIWQDGLFQQLKKQIVEVLASELEHDLGYSKHSKAPKMGNNRHGGSYEKTIIDENGIN